MKTPNVIPISKTAKFSSQVSSIVMEPFQVDHPVQFTITSPSCPRPYYVFRLAGPALIVARQQHHFDLDGNKFPQSIIKYREGVGQLQFAHRRGNPSVTMVDQLSHKPKLVDFSSSHNQSTSDQGTITKIQMYPIPRSGNYSLEILQTSCNSTFETARVDCLPDNYSTMVLNQFPTFLKLERQEELRNQLGAGYYGFKNDQDTAQGATPTTEYPLIRTRHQYNTSEGVDDYEWASNYTMMGTPALEYPNYHKDIRRHFCFVGASHARQAAATFRDFFAKHKMSTHSAIAIMKVWFPQDVRAEQAQRLGVNNSDTKCTDAIVAIAQWTLSHHNQNRKPDPPEVWADILLNTVIRHLEEQAIPHNKDLRIFFRTIHQNSPKRNALSCPTTDFRNPHFTEAYNEKLRELFDPDYDHLHNNTLLTKPDSNYQFIDTNAAVLPIWDTWPDWNHLSDEATKAECRYMLDRMSLVDPLLPQPRSVGTLTPSSTPSNAPYTNASHKTIPMIITATTATTSSTQLYRATNVQSNQQLLSVAVIVTIVAILILRRPKTRRHGPMISGGTHQGT